MSRAAKRRVRRARAAPARVGVEHFVPALLLAASLFAYHNETALRAKPDFREARRALEDFRSRDAQ